VDAEVVGDIVVRFLLGGAIVSLFAVIGGVVRPSSFAGIFGSAPSVALATLSLTFAKDGRGYAATEARSMMIGAAGLIAYSVACMWTIRRPGMPVWAGAAFCWLVWLTVAFGLGAFVARIVP